MSMSVLGQSGFLCDSGSDRRVHGSDDWTLRVLTTPEVPSTTPGLGPLTTPPYIVGDCPYKD